MNAPIFSLPNQNGEIRSLNEYRGHWVVVYFYPKDDTPGCTTEACSFRDTNDLFINQNITVFGISKDSVVAHKKFADKYHLSFDLLSDPTAETIKAYGAWGTQKFLGKEYDGILRTTFIIGPDGEIKKEYPKVTPSEHAQNILEDIQSLKTAP